LKPGKVVLVVLDGVGVGALPDAHLYGDAGTNTVGNTAAVLRGIRLPNLQKLGLGNLTRIEGVPPGGSGQGCYGMMAERSAGKDSTTGHWELAGLVTNTPFPIYPHGFPYEVLREFLRATGCKGYLGNKPASGTEIILELGDEHRETGYPIVYTSGDSVFQIAAHEEVIPLKDLYSICAATRKDVMVGSHAVGRIIARPFVGTSGAYTRTTNRRDFAVEPAGKTLLDLLLEAGIETVGVGKIDDLFSGRGLREVIHTTSNAEGVQRTIDAARRLRNGFVMTNLVDFDTLYGHRQDPRGMGAALEAFDRDLPAILGALSDGDLLMISADHGNDPTDNSTDHSREYVPLLCHLKGGKKSANLGVRSTFADVAQTVGQYFSLEARTAIEGSGFLDQIV
jgi:phosphopentomutase